MSMIDKHISVLGSLHQPQILSCKTGQSGTCLKKHPVPRYIERTSSCAWHIVSAPETLAIDIIVTIFLK